MFKPNIDGFLVFNKLVLLSLINMLNKIILNIYTEFIPIFVAINSK